MGNTRFFITSFLLAAMPVLAAGQSDIPESDKTVSTSHNIFAKTSNDNHLDSILRKDRPQGAGEIPVPHFALQTAGNKFILTLGGEINVITGGDFGNNLYNVSDAGINFIPGQIPVPSSPGKKGDFYINPLNAQIDLQIVALGGTANQLTGYIKIGTDGNSTGLNLQRAYLSWRGITMGQKVTLFQDAAAAQPPTIDPQGPAGCVSGTVYEISYVSPIFNGFRFAAGIDMPAFCAASGRYHGKDFTKWHGEGITGVAVVDPTGVDQTIPDFPMWAEWSASANNRVRISAIIRCLRYRDLLASTTRRSPGWGIMLSGNINPVSPLIIYLQAAYGKGIGNYIQDIAGHPYSFIPSDDKPGHMTPAPMMGVNIGMTYNINRKWQVNAMASEARIWNVAAYADAASASLDYKYGLYAAANVFYNISSYFQVGMEYLYGRHQTWNIGGASDHRLQMQVAFTI